MHWLAAYSRAHLAPPWRALTGSASAAAAALGLLACLCTLLAVVGPRAGAQLRTGAYRQFIASAPALQKTITGTIDYNAVSSPVGLSTFQLQVVQGKLQQHLAGLPLAPARADWSSVTTPVMGVTDKAPQVQAALGPDAELSYRSNLAANAQLIAGTLPAGKPAATAPGSATVILQVAVTQPTARRFGVVIGSELPLPNNGIVLKVTGIVRPKDAGSTFWTADGAVAAPQFVMINPNEGYWLGGFLLGPSGVPALFGRANTAVTQVTWTFPLAIGHLTAAQAIALRPVLAGALTTAGYINNNGELLSISMFTDALTLITNFAAEAAAVGNVLDPLAVSLAVLAAAVVLLTGWLLAEQRRPDFAVLRARGAARRQLAGLVLAVSAVTAVPGAVAGAAIAVALTPSGAEQLSWWLAGLELLAALAGPVLVTVRTHRGYAAVVRPDAPPARVPAVRRLMIEGGLLLIAAGGLAVLRSQGAGASGDVYASAVPILLAVAVAVIMLRVYPLLVRGLLRVAGRRAGPSAFLGLVRAARVSGSAALPAFAMVLALALVGFVGMVRGAVTRGEVAASWQQAGADVVVTGFGPATAALQRSVAAVPGVQHVAAVAIGDGFVSSVRKFNVLLVDPSQYASLLAASPLPQPPATFTASRAGHGNAPLPVLASPGLAAQLGHGPATVLADGESVTVQVVGQAPSMSAVGAIGGEGGYLVLNRRAVVSTASGAADALLVTGSSINEAALRAAVAEPGTKPVLMFRSEQLGLLEQAPLQHGAYLALALGAAAAACCGLLVLLLSLLLSASARQLALARMSTMGLSVGQGRLVGLVELLPQLLAVLAGGLACAAALVPLTGPALSLGIFTGSASSVPVKVEPEWLLVAGVGLLVLELVILTGQTMLTDRTAARSLRMGE